MSSSPAELSPGAVFGAYRVVRKLGAGGMGIVYEAIQLSLERSVALKILAPELARDPHARERFLQEGRLAARVSHPSLVTVLDVAEVGGRLMLAHELVVGETLETRLTAGALPVELALEVAIAVADVLVTLHGLGILHRDLKPGNLFLSRGRGVLVGDLGIAKDQLGGGLQTRSGMILGTPMYMSPESWQGQPPTAAVDLYALGVVFFECLAGRPPFSSQDPLELSRLHLKSPVPSLLSWRPELPAAYEALVRKALAKDLSARFPDAVAFARALRELPTAQAGGLLPTRPAPAFSSGATRVAPVRSQSRVRPASARHQAATMAPTAPPARSWKLAGLGGVAAVALVAIALLKPSPAPPPPLVVVPPSKPAPAKVVEAPRARPEPRHPGAWILAPELPGDEASPELVTALRALQASHEQVAELHAKLRKKPELLQLGKATRDTFDRWAAPVPSCRAALLELGRQAQKRDPDAASRAARLLAALLSSAYETIDSFGYTQQVWFSWRGTQGDLTAEFVAGNQALELKGHIAKEFASLHGLALSLPRPPGASLRAGIACLRALADPALPPGLRTPPASELVRKSLLELTGHGAGTDLFLVRALGRALRGLSGESISLPIYEQAMANLDAAAFDPCRELAYYDLVMQRNWAVREMNVADARDSPPEVLRQHKLWRDARDRLYARWPYDPNGAPAPAAGLAFGLYPDVRARLSEVRGWLENSSRSLKVKVPPLPTRPARG